MNKDYYSSNNKKSGHEDQIQRQQFGPGGFVPPGRGPGGPPGRQPGGPPGRQPDGPPSMQPGGPPRGVQPPSAPPSFTPELPRMEDSGPAQFGVGGRRDGRDGRDGRGGVSFFWPPRDLRRCLNRFTFIWLINGNSFWFYPIDVRGQFIEGFRWRRNRWEYDRINRNRILFHSCY